MFFPYVGVERQRANISRLACIRVILLAPMLILTGHPITGRVTSPCLLPYPASAMRSSATRRMVLDSLDLSVADLPTAGADDEAPD